MAGPGGVPPTIHHLLQRLPGLRIAVIGDVMLDCYLSGHVHRLSPEAPVPVLRATTERQVPGGAANVAANLASLGCGVALVGLAGRDQAWHELAGCLAAYPGIEATGVVVSDGRRTTRKLRVIGSQQQIVRIDEEDDHPLTAEEEARLIEAATRAIGPADALVISDYDKGGCSDALIRHVIDAAVAAGKTVLVDPKRRDLGAYRGATLLTPNRRELTLATGLPCETDEEAERAAALAHRACDADILLTRSEKGMSFFPRNGDPLHLPTDARTVFDVSGAGDTVIAALAALLAAGATIGEAMQVANRASGIAVSKAGTAVVTADELAGGPGDLDGDDPAPVLSLPDAVHLRRRWAERKLTVGMANGCFDLLHPGHVALIRQAARCCDRLILAVNADDSVRRLKGASRPIQNEHARAAVLSAMRGVAAVIVFADDTPLAIIEALLPDVLVKGGDYHGREVVGQAIVERNGGRLVIADTVAGHSTTALVAASRREPAGEGRAGA